MTEALKNTQIDTLLKYITVLQYNFYSAFGSQISIDLKIVANSGFWILTLHIYIVVPFQSVRVLIYIFFFFRYTREAGKVRVMVDTLI